MSDVKWTNEQLSAINEKGNNILVAAAAGSGKTAVLVERIINKIINEKIDIDNILVVTFTNAAASEMRERILDAIYKYLDEHPEDEHMQKQTMLIYKANISTIHSFCLDVIRNNFYEIDVSPNFRIGEQTEIELLKQDVLEEIFEQKYEEEDKEFLRLIHTYTSYRGDEQLQELILKIYRFIQASPFPEEWLHENVEKFNLKNKLGEDFSKTEWGVILLNLIKEEIQTCMLELNSVRNNTSSFSELDKFTLTLSKDIEMLENVISKCSSWENAYDVINSIKWEIWPRDSKITLEEKEVAKQKRDEIKKKCNKIRDKILIYNSKQANEDIYSMYPILKSISNLVLEFSERFLIAKKERNLIDFNDIEHFALKILLKKEDGKWIPTQTAKKYSEKFVEIAIDEYQDSNLVQEYILSTISKNNNIFMVGDVKQSIYRFRQARPELFLEKYDTYKLKNEKKENENLKIQLFKNFRSRKNILDFTNTIFESIMNKDLGDITYDEQEYLNLGANYDDPKGNVLYAGKTELNIIDLKQSEEDTEDEEEKIDDIVLEAKLVAKKIQELISSKYQIYDKKVGYRDITYKDIVILLRATSVLAPIYEKELNLLNIPVFSDVGIQYIDSVEIQTILALLKIIDNPMQDIPLVTVMRSPIGEFDDNELITIKLEGDKEGDNTYFYETLLKSKELVDDKLRNKIKGFLDNIENWRKQNEYLSIAELIWKIYLDTGYYNYVSLMPNGGLRQANLKLLFEKAKEYEKASFKGLFNFINFMDKLNVGHGDTDSAKLIGENENVTRIMSIHKSKGLEFPVVFLCSTGKKINLQDINENILLHQDIGFGPKFVDYERRIEYNTLAKEAISNKIKTETISEEMRILYVALTRAKEKLIITGMKKDLEKDLLKKEEQLEIYNREKIPSTIIKSNPSYLDWIELVSLNKKDNLEELIELKTYSKDELIKIVSMNKTEKEAITFDKLGKCQEKKLDEVRNKLDWEYYYMVASKIPAKTSVTEIKKETQEENIHVLQIKEEINTNKENMKVPNFLKGEQKITGAKKGTLMHLCIQKLNEKEEYNREKIENTIKDLVVREIITEKEAEAIDIEKLLIYTKSNLFKELKTAKKVYKEQAFYITMKAREIYNNNLEDEILVQGIIDLYYINKNDQFILVDYKTDYVKNDGYELVNKYKKQLELYKRALEQSTGKKVDKVYIYSIYLDKIIEV